MVVYHLAAGDEAAAVALLASGLLPRATSEDENMHPVGPTSRALATRGSSPRGRAPPGGAEVRGVADVLPTGLAVGETISAVRAAGGEVAGVGVLIDRAQNETRFGCPLFASYKVDAESWAAEDVPEWLAKIEITKPGTRK